MEKINLQYQYVEAPALDLRRSKYDWDPIDEGIEQGQAVKVTVPPAQTAANFRNLIIDRYKRRGIKVSTQSADADGQRAFVVWPREVVRDEDDE